VPFPFLRYMARTSGYCPLQDLAFLVVREKGGEDGDDGSAGIVRTGRRSLPHATLRSGQPEIS